MQTSVGVIRFCKAEKGQKIWSLDQTEILSGPKFMVPFKNKIMDPLACIDLLVTDIMDPKYAPCQNYGCIDEIDLPASSKSFFPPKNQ